MCGLAAPAVSSRLPRPTEQAHPRSVRTQSCSSETRDAPSGEKASRYKKRSTDSEPILPLPALSGHPRRDATIIPGKEDLAIGSKQEGVNRLGVSSELSCSCANPWPRRRGGSLLSFPAKARLLPSGAMAIASCISFSLNSNFAKLLSVEDIPDGDGVAFRRRKDFSTRRNGKDGEPCFLTHSWSGFPVFASQS